MAGFNGRAVIDKLLDSGLLYRLWQAPFEGRKFAPVAGVLAEQPPRSVLDVGCGPGTNATHFQSTDYIGIDLNPRYIDLARRRFGNRFVAGDATNDLPTRGAPYDFILLNSLLHHLDDAQVDAVLAGARSLLAPAGQIHVLDLELAASPGAARFLARNDRGDHVRPRAEWRQLLARTLEVHSFEPYALGVGSWRLWQMFYCRAGGN